ncbi:MAG: putrescine ABC transporter permease PotH, partial [Xanthobacteraceae bacterium]
DWPVASSIAMVLLAVLLTPILFYQRMQTRDPERT